MPLIAKDAGGGDFTPVPEGTHIAVCNMVVDLGLQETTYDNKPTVKHQCFIRWELPHERIDWTDKDGTPKNGPMSIGKTYTLSLSDKANLRKDLQAWRGRAFKQEELDGFDLFKLLGVGCQVTVVHAAKNGKTYANIAGVAGWPKGLPKPQVTENQMMRYSADEPESYESLPQWLREKIDRQIKENGHAEEPPPNDGYGAGAPLNDDIPFAPSMF